MHAPLLQHHVALRRHHLVGQRQAGHAVGLELHQFGEVLLGDALEIGGVVVAGEGVLLAADLGDAPGELALRVGLVPLNIRCSRKWAMPDLPGGSSAEPLRYHTMWVTTGAR